MEIPADMTMKIARRTFLRAAAGVCGYAALSPFIAKAQQIPSDLYNPGLANPGLEWPPNQALPSFAAPVHLDAADIQALSGDQQALLRTLQGIVNRRQPRLYLFSSTDGTDQAWLETAKVPNTVTPDPLSLIGKYWGDASGAVIYDPNVPDTINVATSLAGVMGSVIATADLASEYKFSILEDLRHRFSNKIEAYNWLIDNYWPKLTPRLLTGISPATSNLRDYIVATQALVFWLDPSLPGEAALFAKILRKVAPNTPYLGWFVNGDEFPGVTLCSRYGVVVAAADFLDNATVLGGVRAPIRGFQPDVPVPPVKNKIYVTLTMSDGDNMQYDQHRLRTIWDDPNRGKVPINWSISPLLLDAAPVMLSYYQATQTPNDLLVAGPSGAGYTYPGDWPSADLPSFTNRTGEYMERAGMNVIYALNLLNNGAGIGFTDAVALDYVEYVPLLGVLGNWNLSGSTLATPAGLPVMTQVIIATVGEGQAVLAAAARSWNGSGPLFVAILVDAWQMAPTDVNALVSSLGTQYEVVRADVFFKLLRTYRAR